MAWLLYIPAAILVAFVLFVLFGVWRLRRGAQQAEMEIRGVALSDLHALVQECVEIFRVKLELPLDLDDFEDSAHKLDTAFHNVYRLKGAFARAGFYWYFVKPVGACIGEILRRHARYEWINEPDTAPSMQRQLRDGQITSYPFEKAIKQANIGRKGDLYAYFVAARGLEDVAQTPPDQTR
jgi:hypothetical protein